MSETLLYLVATMASVIVLIKVAPPGQSPLPWIFVTIALFVLLAVARHGPDQLVAVIDALGRLIGRK